MLRFSLVENEEDINPGVAKLNQDGDAVYLGRAYNGTAYNYIDADIDELVLINATAAATEALKVYERGRSCLVTDDELTHYYCFSNNADDEVGSIDGVMNAEATTTPDLRGVIGYWNFDKDTSTIVRDWSGLGNDGTYESDAHATDDGKYGRGLDVNLTDDSVHISMDASPANYIQTVSF